MAKVLKCGDLMPGCNFVVEGKDVAEFDALSFPTRPTYTGDPWFLPVVGSYYRLRDWLERRLAAWPSAALTGRRAAARAG